MTDLTRVPHGTRASSSALVDQDYHPTRHYNDDKLQRFSMDHSEERRTEPRYHNNYGTRNSPPGKPDKLYTSRSGLSISDSEVNENLEKEQRGNSSSNNTSALLEDNLEDLDSLDVGSKSKENRREPWDREHETDELGSGNKRIRPDLYEDDIYKKDNYRDTRDIHQTANMSLGDSYEPTELFNREVSRDDLTFTKDLEVSKSKKHGDDTVGSLFSGKKPYGGSKDEEFALDSSIEKSNKKSQQRYIEPESLQINRKNVDFGVLYPTETREETLEIFNKGRTDLNVDLRLKSSRSMVKFYMLSEEDDAKENTLSFKINKYTFKVVRIVVEMNTFGSENEKEFTTNLSINTDKNEQAEVPLTCRMEGPSLQILESNVSKMVGNVPFIDFDTSKQSSEGELQIAFKNNGRRLLLLEFELVTNPKLAEIVFTPKYLTLKEGEEKTVGIKAIRSYNYSNKKKAILKYRVKGTQLCQCIVVNLLQNN